MAVETELVPYRDEVVDQDRKLSSVWSSFFRTIQNLIFYIKKETTFVLVNNQSSAANIDGLSLDKRYYSQAIVEYLVQRTTNSSEMVQTGTLYAYYLPSSGSWVLSDKVTTGTGWTSYTPTYSNLGTVTTTQADYLQDGKSLYVRGRSTLGTTVAANAAISLPSGFVTSNTASLSIVNGALVNNSGTLLFLPVIQVGNSTFQLGSHAATVLTAVHGNTIGASGEVITWSAGPIPVSTGTGLAGITFSITSDGQIQYTTTNQAGTGSISRIVYRLRQIEAKSNLYSQVG